MGMNVVIAPDSFKGTLSARAAALAMERGIRRADMSVVTKVLPMADGGEGTLDVLLETMGGTRHSVDTFDPLGRPIQATYGCIGQDTAVIELAEASGLGHVPDVERTSANALRASTYGTGILLHRAIEAGVRRIILTLGGSATSDGGYGLFAALGAKYLDANGTNLDGRNAIHLSDVQAIDLAQLDPRITEVHFSIVSDVENPLCGEQGAAMIYGPQKGLDESASRKRDRDLARWYGLLSAISENALDERQPSGLGAAGGASLPLVLFVGAQRMPGAKFIADTIQLQDAVQYASFVLTGEGCTDATSVHGKVVGTVARMAQKYGIPCVVISGQIGHGANALQPLGVTDVIAASPTSANSEELQVCAAGWLEITTFEVFRRKVQQ